jgi:hypothetical protein
VILGELVRYYIIFVQERNIFYKIKIVIRNFIVSKYKANKICIEKIK